MLYGYRQLHCSCKIEDIYKDTEEDAETRYHTSNFELDRPLSKGKNKNLIGLMKDELGGHIMKEIVDVKAKKYICLKDNNDEDKIAKSTITLLS